jgi:hypothetical protein
MMIGAPVGKGKERKGKERKGKERNAWSYSA